MRILLLGLALSVTSMISGCGPAKDPETTKKTQDRPEVADKNECPLYFEQIRFCGKVIPMEPPLRADVTTRLLIKFWKSNEGDSVNGPFVSPGKIVKLKLWMDMGSSSHSSTQVPVVDSLIENKKEVPGVYTASNVLYTMKGLWQHHVTVIDENGQANTAAETNVEVLP